MTAIVGLKHEGDVWVGADSMGIRNEEVKMTLDIPKVFRNGEFLIGYSGHLRSGQLLQYQLKPSPIKDDCDLVEYMVKWFVEDVRECLKAGGYAQTENGIESGATFLVAVRGRLFEVDPGYQVVEHSAGYSAIGSAIQFCLASLFNTPCHPPEKRVLAALMTAAHFDPYCGGPFVVEKL